MNNVYIQKLRLNEYSDESSDYVYLLYYVCIAVLTLEAGMLARSQYPESPTTGHLDTGFSWFPCVYKRMLDGSQVSKLLLHASHVALPN